MTYTKMCVRCRKKPAILWAGHVTDAAGKHILAGWCSLECEASVKPDGSGWRGRWRYKMGTLEAKHCCECRHWHRVDRVSGECQHPRKHWGIEYENEKTGETRCVERRTTGMYATCKDWEVSK